MKLKVLGSSSHGNGYLLIADNGETLILECGEKFLKVKEALNFDLSGVVGALCSHVHFDHSLEIKAFTNSGVKVYSNKQVVNNFGGEIFNLKIVEPNKQFMVGGFTVMPFEVRHDPSIETYGYMVKHEELGKLIFATDLVYCKYKFNDINHFLVEANYDSELVNGQNSFLTSRIINSHFSIQNCIEFLKSNDLSQTENIVLLHLSDSRSDERRFKKMVEDATMKNVTVANKGVEIPLNRFPF